MMILNFGDFRYCFSLEMFWTFTKSRLKIPIADVNSPSPSSLCPFKVLITCTLFCISSSVLTMISLKFDCTPRFDPF